MLVAASLSVKQINIDAQVTMVAAYLAISGSTSSGTLARHVFQGFMGTPNKWVTQSSRSPSKARIPGDPSVKLSKINKSSNLNLGVSIRFLLPHFRRTFAAFVWLDTRDK